MLRDRLATMIPAPYGFLLLTLMLERGHQESSLLKDAHLTRAHLADPNHQIGAMQYGAMLRNALAMEGDIGFAYELGLRSQVTHHGFVGFGLMSCPTLREALAFSNRYFLPRISVFSTDERVEGNQFVIELLEMFPLGKFREVVLVIGLVEGCNLFARARGADPVVDGWSSEVWFPFPESPAYAPYKWRLPKFHFNAPSAQIRMPLSLLDQPIATGNPLSLKLIAEQCEQDLTKVSGSGAISEQTARRLICRHGRYPELGEIAASLLMSERTLKRRLQEEGTSYNALLDEARLRDSMRLLSNPSMAIKQVAEAVGYADRSNFARAFLKWTGLSPRTWREQHVARPGPK